MINSWGAIESTDWHFEAALKLRAALKENGELGNLRKAVRKPEWWDWAHFGFGLFVRNWLRMNGFSEKDVDVANLDDHYAPVMLLAAGYEVEGGYDPFMPHDELITRLVNVYTKDKNPS